MAERPDTTAGRTPSEAEWTDRWAGRLALLGSLGLSRLGRRITVAITVSILLIETAILIPSYLRFGREQLDHLVAEAESALRSGFAQYSDGPVRDLRAVGQSIAMSTVVAGGALYDDSGAVIGVFGEVPHLRPLDLRRADLAGLVDDGKRYERMWLKMQSGLPFTVVLRLDSSGVSDASWSYLWRVVGLVLAITAFVTGSTLLIFSRYVLRPVLALSAGLVAARDDPKNAADYVPDYDGNDEIGEMVRSLCDLLKQVSEASRRDLAASEQRFKDFADAASDFFWEMDTELRFSYFSERFHEVSTVDPSSLLGRTREETGIPGLPRAELERHLAQLHAHEPFRNFVHPRTAPDGRRVYLSISGMPVFDANGEFAGYRGSGSDITTRIEFEDALRAASERAEEANRAKSEFLALMSHELRTPLNAILGFSEIIASETFGPSGKPQYTEYAGDIHHSAEHLLGLINDILDLSKIESGRYELTEDRVAVGGVVDEALRYVTKSAETKRIVLSVDITPGCPDVLGDATALMRVMVNLVSNAVKFTPEDGRVAVRAREQGADLVLTIEDTGVGISKADLERVFEPFQQLENGYQRRHEGTGLGLAIVRSLVQGHDGTIEMTSEPGHGTTVIIRLPGHRLLRRALPATGTA